MALRTLRLEGDSILRKESRPVKEITPNILTLLDDLAETMVKHNGCGIAAPQVGVLRRLVVVDVGEGVIELINPEIIEKDGSQVNREACLSIPGKAGTVDRPERVKVRALDRKGNENEIEGEGLLATALCHEIDHLNGVLFTDKVIEYLDAESEDDEE